jgi:hypothetical protein
VDNRQRSCLTELANDPASGPLWRTIADALDTALGGGDRDALERAAQAAARSVALGRRGPRLAVLNDQLLSGLDRLRACGTIQHEETFSGLRTVLLRAVAEGYAEGLEETIAELRREAESLSPSDPKSGVLRPRQTGEQLGLDLARCQRMDLPLGVAAVTLVAEGASASGRLPARRTVKVGRTLRESVRRYDGVGSLEDGRYVLFLPGVSRDGLLTAVERLHRLIDEDPRPVAGARCAFALLHLDCADLSVTEILAALGESAETTAADYLVWV